MPLTLLLALSNFRRFRACERSCARQLKFSLGWRRCSPWDSQMYRKRRGMEIWVFQDSMTRIPEQEGKQKTVGQKTLLLQHSSFQATK
ncbi:hypothetical protein NDU88_000246 [Pleurodeles waltl]|uniref:Secreted protein n=1 Tax=Pleurodeles waltl TaxID=8319 RepID=A0AAV7KPF2_PLEWA|nr:hypothetical protein NDU88_000246 [Pleurodeles waltl]